MAIMIPPFPSFDAEGVEAEKDFFGILRSRLSDNYFVYYKLKFIERDRAKEGEIDFLILHRELGLLAVECKGGGVYYDSTGQCISRYRDGKEKILKEDPFNQAQEAIKSLIRILTERGRSLFPEIETEFPLIHGHANAFPFASLKSLNLPQDKPQEIIIDQDDLEKIEERVRQIVLFWSRRRKKPEPLSPSDFKRFQKDLLYPCLNLVPTLGAKLESENRQFVRLSEEQIRVMKGFVKKRRLVVEGGAGTGKSLLALEGARLLTSQGKDTLLLCYNKHLAAHLESLAMEWEPRPGKLDVNNFHKLCANSAKALDQKFSPPSPDKKKESEHFWNYEAPLILLDAIEKKKFPCQDAVIIDEGQDFEESWWGIIEQILKDKENGNLFIFYDPAQNIFGRVLQGMKFEVDYTLHYNFRNTQQIAGLVRCLGQVETESHPDCPMGEPVNIQRPRNQKEALKILETLVKHLVEKDKIQVDHITILTPHSHRSLLEDMKFLGRYPLVLEPMRRKDALLHMSIYGFKGLESEVVILADIDPKDDLCGELAQYTGASRACNLLYVLATPGWKDPRS